MAIEHFPYNEGGLGIPYVPGFVHPNTANWTWREYGNRIGAGRVLDLLSGYSPRPTVLVNSECYQHCPTLLEAYRSAGAEVVGHGVTNAITPNELSREDEGASIAEAIETIARAEGKPPAGG